MPGGSFDKSDIDVSAVTNELGKLSETVSGLTDSLNGLNKANNIKLKIKVDAKMTETMQTEKTGQEKGSGEKIR